MPRGHYSCHGAYSSWDAHWKLASLIAIQRISLILPSFNDLSEEDKWSLFDECVQPRLEFPVALKDRALR